VLSLSAPDLHRAPAADGFAWWYCDLVGERGEGVVLIWSVGLPFVPARDGDGDALARPSCSLAVYRDGRERFYLLSAGRPSSSLWDAAGSVYRVDESRFVIRRDLDRVALQADIDAPIPGGSLRVRGSIELHGQQCVLPSVAGAPSAHAWGPLAAACSAEARLDLGDGSPLVIRGRGYLDGNRSDVPLSDLSIEDWRWGRVAMPDRELVYFLLQSSDGSAPKHLILEIAPDGSVVARDDVTIAFDEGRHSLYGLRRTRVLELRARGDLVARIRYTSLVDDGPFYQRYLIDAEDGAGLRGRGFAERVVPARIGLAWQRPFVEMRLHRRGETASRWLPLFSGPTQGRVRRLLSSWARGSAAGP